MLQESCDTATEARSHPHPDRQEKDEVMSKAIRILQRYLREESKKYPPFMVDIPFSEWPDTLLNLKEKPREVWRSNRFLVQIFPLKDGAARMTICRTMVNEDGLWVDGISWEELMAIKDQCRYGKDWAVEIFPPCDQIVNVANMRHLWLIPDAPSFAWRNPQ